MKLGNLEIPRTAALSPMAGVGDTAFRLTCKRFGAAYVVGVMGDSWYGLAARWPAAGDFYEALFQSMEKAFPEAANPTEALQDYLVAFTDCMTNYSYGTEGRFQDIYPRYAALMASPVSYKNASEIAYLGAARFYPENI